MNTDEAAALRASTAHHEAGHAWAYYRHGLPLRYATIRPRTRGHLGHCIPWKPRRIGPMESAFIAAAGPMAQAVWDEQAEPEPDEFIDWRDYVMGAVLTGGHDDLAQACGLLDGGAAEWVRGEVLADWVAISQVAAALVIGGTVHGADLRRMLAR